jgi:pimeloyl-ACP methyl ester carboxylesterase
MEIDFLEFGKKGAKNIVFLHGWQQDKKSFAPLVPFLFKKSHLFLIDLPGFGKS